MAHCYGKLNLPLAYICISIITILIQIKLTSCANEGNVTTSVDTVTSPMTPIKTKTANKKHTLFDGSLEGINLTDIPGWRDDDDFDNWIPPREIQLDMPTYIAGFDNISRPIWVMEFGKYNFGKYAKGGKAKQELFHKYSRYLAYIGLKSHSLRSTVEHPVHKHVKIYDYQGFRPEFLTDRKVNAVSEIWLNVQNKAQGFIKTRLFRRGNEEFYGTNKYEWGPKLARSFPVNQLPEWYGGRKDFKPVYVIG